MSEGAGMEQLQLVNVYSTIYSIAVLATSSQLLTLQTVEGTLPLKTQEVWWQV